MKTPKPKHGYKYPSYMMLFDCHDYLRQQLKNKLSDDMNYQMSVSISNTLQVQMDAQLDGNTKNHMMDFINENS